jgi:hypothetical protein
MNNFREASRLKLRFNINGSLSSEQLWTVPMNLLADYEQELSEKIESYGKATRRTKKRRTKSQEMEQLQLEIVTEVLDVREAEEQAAKTAQENKLHNQKILELIQAKKETELVGKSVEELEAMLK